MQKEEGESEEDSFLCPSFSTYSSNRLADIANQVITKEHLQNDTDLDPNDNNEENDGHDKQNDGDNDFEFVAFRKAADGVFFDRHVDGLVFPIFNSDLAGPRPERDGGRIAGSEEVRLSMEKLLIGDEEEHRRSLHDPPSSSTSSEVGDELDAIPAGTYCVWTPDSVQASPNRCKKSNSTGSSSLPSPAKKWKLLDLLRRSNSDGKKSLVFLTPSSSSSSLGFGAAKKKDTKKNKEGPNVKSKEERSGGRRSNENGGGGGVVAGKMSPPSSPAAGRVSAHEALYVRNREMRRLEKRRSYLPYKQGLVGFCAALNGMGRTFPPF